jgi:hypothetical protein
MEERGFNFDRYQSLMRQTDRYRRYLAAAQEQVLTEKAGGHQPK